MFLLKFPKSFMRGENVIHVEIENGSRVLCRMPMCLDNKMFRIDFREGQVIKIETVLNDKLITFYEENKEYTVEEYRVFKFTFGGIWVMNPKWDYKRIVNLDDKFCERKVL